MAAWTREGAVALKGHSRFKIHSEMETTELADALDVRSERELSSWVDTSGCHLGDGKDWGGDGWRS